MLHRLDENKDFNANITFCDEATFHLSVHTTIVKFEAMKIHENSWNIWINVFCTKIKVFCTFIKVYGLFFFQDKTINRKVGLQPTLRYTGKRFNPTDC